MSENAPEFPSEHENKLDAVYEAIAALRKRGDPVNHSTVARESGVSRGTISASDLSDWLEVREVIKGKPSPRLALAEVELTETQKWERQVRQLHKKIDELESTLLKAQTVSNDVFHRLLAQVNKYVVLMHRTPMQIGQQTSILEANAKLRERLAILEADNEYLKAEKNVPGNVLGFVRKETINIFPPEMRPKLHARELHGLSIDAMNELDRFFKDQDLAPRLVYLMCGPFAAGKSRWVYNHKPIWQSNVLYIDGTNHTLDLRMLFIKRLKSLNQNCRIVCCRVFSTVDECLERNTNPERKRMDLTVPEAVMRHVHEAFEEVSFDEGFDAIELVGGPA
jgi:hypothetical protein